MGKRFAFLVLCTLNVYVSFDCIYLHPQRYALAGWLLYILVTWLVHFLVRFVFCKSLIRIWTLIPEAKYINGDNYDNLLVNPSSCLVGLAREMVDRCAVHMHKAYKRRKTGQKKRYRSVSVLFAVMALLCWRSFAECSSRLCNATRERH